MKFSLKKTYSESWDFLKESKNQIYLGIIIFCSFIMLGFIFPIFFNEQIMNFIKNILEKIGDYNVYELMSFIFLNNLKSAFFAIIFGIALGIFPITIAIVNGYLIGFVSRYSVSQEGVLVLWRLLPHGIFELPAILISIGLGIKIGKEVIQKRKFKKIKEPFLKSLKVFLFIILPLLFIAAIIEGILVFFIN